MTWIELLTLLKMYSEAKFVDTRCGQVPAANTVCPAPGWLPNSVKGHGPQLRVQHPALVISDKWGPVEVT